MKEIWKDIPEYEGIYKISNLGRVKSKNKIRKPYLRKTTGYCYVTLSKNNKVKCYSIHRLVANSFIDNIEKKPYVNHIDGNKQNNNVKNLEWVTQKENVIHAIKVLKVDYSKGIEIMHEKNKVKVIRSDGIVFNSIKEAKEKLNNKNAHIVEVCQGKLKTACGYGWKYYREE